MEGHEQRHGFQGMLPTCNAGLGNAQQSKTHTLEKNEAMARSGGSGTDGKRKGSASRDADRSEDVNVSLKASMGGDQSKRSRRERRGEVEESIDVGSASCPKSPSPSFDSLAINTTSTTCTLLFSQPSVRIKLRKRMVGGPRLVPGLSTQHCVYLSGTCSERRVQLYISSYFVSFLAAWPFSTFLFAFPLLNFINHFYGNSSSPD